MQILVTGGSGFLGSHVADKLSKAGHKVTVFDKKKSKWLKTGQKMFIGDILNFSDLNNAIKNQDIIYHFAALADLDQAHKQPINTVNTNILGTVKVLEVCRKYKIKRFIYASSIYVNSVDGGFYRSSKKAAEDYVEEFQKVYGLDYTILRFGSLYGPRADNNNGMKKILKNAINKGIIKYGGSKKNMRKYIHVLDAANACASILKFSYKNKHITITGNKKIKVAKLLKNLSNILNISKKVKFEDRKSTGHYTETPFSFKPRPGNNFKFKSNLNIYDEMLNLIKDIKNEKNYKKNN